MNRVHVDVLHSCSPMVASRIVRVVNALLPDLHVLSAHFVNLMRASAFDELDGLLKARRRTGGENEVQLVGHNDEFIEQVGLCVTVVEERVQQDVGNFYDLKGAAVLPTFRVDEIGGAGG